MTTLYGHVGKFVEEQEEWPQYVEKVHFFAANDVKGVDKVCHYPLHYRAKDL